MKFLNKERRWTTNEALANLISRSLYVFYGCNKEVTDCWIFFLNNILLNSYIQLDLKNKSESTVNNLRLDFASDIPTSERFYFTVDSLVVKAKIIG